MRQMTSFGLTLLSLLLLVSIGVPTVIKLEKRLSTPTKLQSHQYAIQEVGAGVPSSLDLVSGDDVLGMVLPALDGEFVLILDGVRIEQDTDMDYVNLAGVVGAKYKLTVDQSGSIPIIVAGIN